jgi:hypothetical protein
MNFTEPIRQLYAELDATRAAIAEVPFGALIALIGRYDRAREQAQPPAVDADDPASVRAMCATLAPLYQAVGEWEHGLVAWIIKHDPNYDGPMAELSLCAFQVFFRAILEQKRPGSDDLVDRLLISISVLGDDPWRIICAP